MEISGIKENVNTGPPQVSVQRPADKPEPFQEKKNAAPAPQAPKSDAPPRGEEKIRAVTENINLLMRSMSYSLQFVTDRENGKVVIKVLDGEGKVVRQIPPEAAAAISATFGNSVGLVVNETLE